MWVLFLLKNVRRETPYRPQSRVASWVLEIVTVYDATSPFIRVNEFCIHLCNEPSRTLVVDKE